MINKLLFKNYIKIFYKYLKMSEENINKPNINKINSYNSLNNNNILNNFGFGENFFESIKLFNLSEKNLINSNNNIKNSKNYKSAFRKIISVSTAETSMLSQKSLSKIPNKNEMMDLYQEDEAEYIPLENNENKFINKIEDDFNNNFSNFKLNLNEIIGNNNNLNNINNNINFCINNNFENNLFNNNIYFNNNDNINNDINNINNNNNNNNNKNIIKAYKSKHKIKYSKIYEKNSELNKQQNKYKMFHKCNFPNCGRTFSSSGWLKSHFNEHLKLLKKNKFNILFEKYISKKTK